MRNLSVSFVWSFDGGDPDPVAAKRDSVAAWARYWAASGELITGSAEEEFLWHNSLYLLNAAYDDVSGYPIGHPFACPGCWNQCMFWDMHFVMNGLLRTDRLAEARRVLRILKRALRPSGKPYPWMFIYDGSTFLDDSRDIAPVVIAAHAMSAINYYETTADASALEEEVLPIVETCAAFAAEKMFARDQAGRWYVSLAVSNDVVDEAGEEVNQTYTTLWFLTVLKKAVEYRRLAGREPDAAWEDILGHYYLEHTEEEYLHCRNHSAADWRWASWIPFLAYPTEGLPFLDENLLRKTCERYSYSDLYLQKQNCYQPWMECTEAEALHRTGERERAYTLIRSALGHAYGDGYFCEIGPLQQTCGFPPYITAHGQYLSVWADTVFGGSIWEKKLKICVDLPDALCRGGVRAARLRAAKGAFLETLELRAASLRLTLGGGLSGFEIVLRIPEALEAEEARIYVNGERTAVTVDRRARTAAFVLGEADAYRIEAE